MNNIQTNNNDARTVNIASNSPINDIEYPNNVVNHLEIDVKAGQNIVGDSTGTLTSTISTPMPNATPINDDIDATNKMENKTDNKNIKSGRKQLISDLEMKITNAMANIDTDFSKYNISAV
eukprot:CAMPEP_0114666074 /NCGR_PEP_ID=MMETSP0191-20121206/31942_1 /TAXON_ID=126664 /ORGANISM="Sorites sp." /LENGTH=120 /DNA_ID=CAMNT_0001912849 /DNA_START=161 /DNA_END=520 /DNA_ORIENTATION=+